MSEDYKAMIATQHILQSHGLQRVAGRQLSDSPAKQSWGDSATLRGAHLQLSDSKDSAPILSALDDLLTPSKAVGALQQIDPRAGTERPIQVYTRTFLGEKFVTLIGQSSLPAGPLCSVVTYALKDANLRLDSTTLNGTFNSAEKVPPQVGVPRGRLTEPRLVRQRTESGFGLSPQDGPTCLVTSSDASGASKQKIAWKRTTPSGATYRLEAGEDGSSRVETAVSDSLPEEQLIRAFRQNLARWGVILVQVESQLFAGLGLPPAELTVAVQRNDKGEALQLIWRGENYQLGIDLVEGPDGARSVHVPGTNLPASAQGKGLGRTLIRNEVEIAKTIGAESVDLEAGSTVGGYAWARIGFQLHDDGSALMREVAQRAKALSLPVETQGRVDEILRSADPQRVWRIADLEESVDQAGQTISLGKALLLGTRWNGTLRLDNASALDRLES